MVPIGRDAELRLILERIGQGGHLLIEGPIGIGKSTLIRHLHRVCPTPSILIPQGVAKPQFLAIAQQLHTLLGLVVPADVLPPTKVAKARRHGSLAWQDIQRAIGRLTVERLAEVVVTTLGIRETRVVCCLESLDLPPAQAGLLARLFEVAQVVAARHDHNQRNRIQKVLWRFGTKLRLQPLPLPVCEQITRAVLQEPAQPVRFSDQATEVRFVRHVARESRGIPAAIVGMVETARTLGMLTPAKVSQLSHDAAALYLDMTPLVVLGFIVSLGMRYVSRGLGETELVVITGVVGALFMALRLLLLFVRR